MTLAESGVHSDVYMLSHIMPIICDPYIQSYIHILPLGDLGASIITVVDLRLGS